MRPCGSRFRTPLLPTPRFPDDGFAIWCDTAPTIKSLSGSMPNCLGSLHTRSFCRTGAFIPRSSRSCLRGRHFQAGENIALAKASSHPSGAQAQVLCLRLLTGLKSRPYAFTPSSRPYIFPSRPRVLPQIALANAVNHPSVGRTAQQPCQQSVSSAIFPNCGIAFVPSAELELYRVPPLQKSTLFTFPIGSLKKGTGLPK
jgi:hypothetical protein